MQEDARLQEFAEAELGRLLEHEARHGVGLVELLRQFLAVGGNKAELARVAHRNRTSLYPALKPARGPGRRAAMGRQLCPGDALGWAGFPFFFWYQFLWVFICAACTYAAHRLVLAARKPGPGSTGNPGRIGDTTPGGDEEVGR